MSDFFVQFLNGVTIAMTIYLIASGLSLVFGVLGVLNFAHGSLYMYGSFLLFSERTGWKHLYHFSASGKDVKPMPSGDWEARALEHVDEEQGWVYFTGTKPVGAGSPGTALATATAHVASADASYEDAGAALAVGAATRSSRLLS